MAASHVYATTGIYNATLTVTDSNGGASSELVQIVVANVPPTILTPLGNVTLNEGQTLSLPTVQFTDPTFANPAQPYSPSFNYTINWGDGSAASTGAATVTQSATSPTQGQFTGSHQYSVPGTYTAMVTVVDNEGGTTSETFQVVVLNVAPMIGPIAAQNTSEGSTFSLAGATFNDPGTQETYTATINWGDGLSSTGTVSYVVTPSGASGTVQRHARVCHDRRLYGHAHGQRQRWRHDERDIPGDRGQRAADVRHVAG